jgi:hypothetical protein
MLAYRSSPGPLIFLMALCMTVGPHFRTETIDQLDTERNIDCTSHIRFRKLECGTSYR